MLNVELIYLGQEDPFPQEFSSIQEAVDSIPEDNEVPVLIRLSPGVYEGPITINKPYVTLEGDSPETTRITGRLGAFEILEDGIKRGTFRTQTVFIDTHDFTARNITFENAAGFGRLAGQALALYVDGDHITFDHCHLLASQDTLFAAPLPPKEVEPGGFRGPKEFAPRNVGRHYYKDCFIRGDVDFIFGGATAYFENCELFSQKTDDEPASNDPDTQKIYGYVTAASTPEGRPFGFVFDHCRLTGNCPDNSCYLGRPWREYAKVVFLNCEMGPHIRPEGWHDWGKDFAHDTILFAEYHSTGPGAHPGKRAAFSRQLTDEEAAAYTIDHILST
ncbi:MAG: pectin methylesterase [Lachnospiraceae bacterium]|nr:pectin methylesterase [Lachnospiraceae bacterium]